ncbi:MAG TPA: PaaI family thioesterase [Thermoanaerobaculia bacterium]|nr:PaaI family thioesterase [Thermoanaerobaculia bacterium]
MNSRRGRARDTIRAMAGKPFLELTRRMISGEAPLPPVAALLGMEMKEVERDRAVMEIAASARHANPMGTLHGGILCDLADGAMGMAWASDLDEGESFTTLELKINYLKPVWEARLTAEAKVVKRGRAVGMVECEVRDERGSLVARASSTMLTLRGEQASGR